jgi:hypothetical protein
MKKTVQQLLYSSNKPYTDEILIFEVFYMSSVLNYFTSASFTRIIITST